MNRLAEALLDVAVWLIIIALTGIAVMLAIGCDADQAEEDHPCLVTADCMTTTPVNSWDAVEHCLAPVRAGVEGPFLDMIEDDAETAIETCSFGGGNAVECRNATNEALATVLRCVVGEP